MAQQLIPLMLTVSYMMLLVLQGGEMWEQSTPEGLASLKVEAGKLSAKANDIIRTESSNVLLQAEVESSALIPLH